MARAWYSFNGGTDTTLLSNYTLMTSNPSCTIGGSLCAIYEFNGGLHPSVISANVQQYISNGLSRGIPQPETSGAKPYVYLKS